MEDAGVAGCGAGVPALLGVVQHGEKKSLGTPGRDGVAEHTCFTAVPPGRACLGEAVAVDMQIIEREGLDTGIIEVLFHRAADHREIVLVQDLVAFQVEGPVAGAVEQRDGFLLAVDESLDLQVVADVFVPGGVEDAYFRVGDGAHHRFRVVLAGAECDDELVDQRQDGPDGFHKRVSEHVRIAQEGKAADSHGAYSPSP